MENQEQLLPYIKKNALIPIEVSAGFLQKLQDVTAAILVYQDPIEVRKFTEQELPNLKDPYALEGWKSHYMVMNILISTIARKAEEMGMVEYKPAI